MACGQSFHSFKDKGFCCLFLVSLVKDQILPPSPHLFFFFLISSACNSAEKRIKVRVTEKLFWSGGAPELSCPDS
jgi:hypothetical protein